ncbi:MAG: septum formation protein Maf [Vicinamibacteria bacterium]|nr:septum formation protein Maf [Vicinamibacteria bacterium]
MPCRRLILASSSPRRARILATLGLKFEIRPADVDESIHPGETPLAAVRRLAKSKATALHRSPSDCVIAADTVVVLNSRVLGKPANRAEALSMLKDLSGRTHTVATGVAVASGRNLASALDLTEVRFRRMTESEIAAYVGTGEPMDKAGAYHVEGGGAAFIEWIRGSPSNVAGLSVTTARRLLKRVGVL